MKTKLSTMLILLLLITSASFAQGYKESIEKRFGEFYGLTAAGKVEEAVEYIPDEFFTIVPKAQMIIALKQVMNNKDIDYKILDYKITEIGDNKLIADKHYAIFSYVSNLTLKFNSTTPGETEDKKKAKLSLIRLSLANSFGTDNVTLNDATETFAISAHKKSCAISATGNADWKFVNIEAGQRLVLDKILPKEITDAL